MHFPDRRSEIYEEALNALLSKWDSSRLIRRDKVYRKLTLNRKQQMFTRIAFDTFKGGQYHFNHDILEEKIISYLHELPLSETEGDIEGDAIIRAIIVQHGIFIEKMQGVYSFYHLTFQEYYTAKYIIESALQGILPSLIKNYYTNTTWREVFLLIAEMFANADVFFEHFISVLNRLIIEKKGLTRLFVKVEKESKETKIQAKPIERRYIILCLILVTASEVELFRNIINPHTPTYPQPLNSILEQTSKCALIHTSIIPASVLARGLSLSLIMRPIIPSSLLVCRDLISFLIDAYKGADPGTNTAEVFLARNNVRIHYNTLVRLYQNRHNFSALYNSLNNLSVPAEGSGFEEWGKFAKALHNVFDIYCNIDEYIFTIEEIEQLKKYLDGLALLLDCLKIAVVSNRIEIEDKLLNVFTMS